MGSPVRISVHGHPEFRRGAWLAAHIACTLRLDQDDEPQPDLLRADLVALQDAVARSVGSPAHRAFVARLTPAGGTPAQRAIVTTPVRCASLCSLTAPSGQRTSTTAPSAAAANHAHGSPWPR